LLAIQDFQTDTDEVHGLGMVGQPAGIDDGEVDAEPGCDVVDLCAVQSQVCLLTL
jgi:hypothetical protein